MSTWKGQSVGWTNIGATGAPAFQNSWQNYGGNWQVAGFQRDGTRVFVRGLVKAGSAMNTVIFTLPLGYRPSADEPFTVMSTGQTPVRLEVHSDGTVLTFGASGANTYLSLAGISFDVG